MKKLFLLSFVLVYSFSHAQECNYLTDESTHRIVEDVRFLASDDLEGRLPGTEGALVASKYIQKEFLAVGLKPLEGNSFVQTFEVPEFVEVNNKLTVVSLNEKERLLNDDFYPVKYSSNSKASGKTIFVGFGISAPDLGHDSYAKIKDKKIQGKIAIMDVSSPDGIHPHSKFVKYHNLEDRINLIKSKGAIGVILINPGDLASDPNMKFRAINDCGIPVIFLKKAKDKNNWKKIKKATLSVSLEEISVEAYNIVGYKDNGSDKTIIIGAHYDHLGWGEDNSLYTGEPQIHNGADDNASGTAGLLELARFFSRDTTLYKFNYLFIAFSGEERGLLGSNYYVKNPLMSLRRTLCMINMDMIGRMEEGQLAISGVGTSPSWSNILREGMCGVDLKLSESGVGPSDHTSFYYQNIPVLHFFTGTHEDYHKPTDDPETLNYEGITKTLDIIIQTINNIGGQDLEFSPTKNEESRKAPKFSVTLGIIPDYMYEDGGVKMDGVTDGKPASNAGLAAGDIIIKLGEIKVSDMHSYMDALAQFKKGDRTIIVYLREGKKHTAEIIF